MTRRILLTGATGFFGRHLRPVLEQHYGTKTVFAVSSHDYDLMDRASVNRMFEEHKPDVVVHLAGYSGGIGANRAFPADFYFRNTILTALTFEAAARFKVDKLIYPMGGCSYPAAAKSPIGEDELFCGYPQNDSAGYSMAKLMGVVAARGYRDQYGLHTTVIVPGNMYGEYDNFGLRESHVIPAMIRRYYETRLSGARTVEMWGSGRPQRDFVYAGDVAKCIPFFINAYSEVGPVNISTGTSIDIKQLADVIAEVTGFDGEIRWDTTKGDGQMVKIYAVDRLRALGLSCDTTLRDGLKRTADWLAANYSTRGEGLRL
jgi:GDP-L-fucose synthase